MKILISPAKKLDLSEEKSNLKDTECLFLNKSAKVMKKLQEFSPSNLSKLMGISDNLSILNYERNQKWQSSLTNGKQALFTFKGAVFQSMKIEDFDNVDLEFANNHLRILSGLYGMIKPSDLILPYRLEMGTKLQIGRNKNLYHFWKETLTNHLLSEIKKDSFLVNLASEEYFKVIDKKEIPIPIITPIFKDFKNGKLKVISFFAKEARGKMCNFIIKNEISTINHLSSFSENGYLFSKENSTKEKLIFIR